MQDWQQLIAESGYEPLIVITLVVIIERILPWPDSYHPLTLFRLIATNLAKKVNPQTPRTTSQRRISGSLAAIILLLPMLIVVSFSVFIAQYPLFFDGFLLLIAVQFRQQLRSFQAVQLALAKDKKSLAKHYLNNLVLRDTSGLSPLGMGKAAIEGLLLRFNFQQFSILIWYLIGGALTALTIRLLYELCKCWNIKLTQFGQFGLPVATLSRYLNWLPSLLLCSILALGFGVLSTLRAYRTRQRRLPFRHTLKLLIGGSMGIQLGGPAIYSGQKIREPKVGGPRDVRFGDLSRAFNAVNLSMFMLLVFIAMFSLLWAKLLS